MTTSTAATSKVVTAAARARATSSAAGAAPAVSLLGFAPSATDPHGLVPVFQAVRFVPADGIRLVGRLEAPWGARLEDGYALAIAPKGKQTVQEHLQRAGERYEHAFASQPPAHGLSAPLYRLAIALHEAGRIGAEQAGKGRGDRFAFMGRFLEANRAFIPVDGATFKRLKALLTTNPLGPYLRPDGKAASLEDTVARITAGADAADLKPWEFLKAITPLYQSDLAAYTVDAGFPKPYFDSAFGLSPSGSLVFDKGLGRLRMNPENEKRWAALETALGAPKPTLTIVDEVDRKAAPAVTEAARAARALEVARDEQMATLNPTQLKVVQRLHERAPISSAAAMPAFLNRARDLGYTDAEAQTVLEQIAQRGNLTIYFRPQKFLLSHAYIADSFIRDGHYNARGQEKESTLFEGLYPTDTRAVPRPKYSALNAEGPYVTGASSVWGTAFLDLKPEVNVRTSLAPTNSEATDTLQTLGTTEHMARVLADPRLSYLHFRQIFDYLLKGDVRRLPDWSYVEGQIHGDVKFDRDLRAVVVVSGRTGADGEAGLRRMANHFGVPLLWHEHGKLVPD